MNRLIPLLLLLVIACGQAQEPTPVPTPKPNGRTLRVLPLGEPPPFRQDVRDGVRYELEPEPGSIPPREVKLGEGATATTVRLNLGRATTTIPLPEGTAPAVLRIAGESGEPSAKPWLTLRPPETGDLLALTWREPGKPWTEARALILPDSAAAFPAGHVRIVNLLPVEAAVIFGTERVLIPSGKTLLRAIPLNNDLAIQIAYREPAGQYKRFHSGSVMLNPNERAQVFLHRADGENPRQPARVVTFNEATPKPPPAKP
jgi:hypothetical protein